MLLYSVIFVASLVCAVPLVERTPTCNPLPSVTDKFDEVTVLPVPPEVNLVLGPAPTGSYLTYQNSGYANSGGSVNGPPPSKPNNIFSPGVVNNIIIKPTFKGANAFKLAQLRSKCVIQSGVTPAEVLAVCTFQVTCSLFGSSGSVSKTFTFTPDSTLATVYNTHNFGAEFSGLSQCSVKLLQSAPLGVLLSPATVPVTILALDNVVNQGQVCK